MRIVKVFTTGHGWQLCGVGEPTFFSSGGRAEAAGRRLAMAAAQAGHPVELQLFDRGGTLAAQVRF